MFRVTVTSVSSPARPLVVSVEVNVPASGMLSGTSVEAGLAVLESRVPFWFMSRNTVSPATPCPPGVCTVPRTSPIWPTWSGVSGSP